MLRLCDRTRAREERARRTYRRASESTTDRRAQRDDAEGEHPQPAREIRRTSHLPGSDKVPPRVCRVQPKMDFDDRSGRDRSTKRAVLVSPSSMSSAFVADVGWLDERDAKTVCPDAAAELLCDRGGRFRRPGSSRDRARSSVRQPASPLAVIVAAQEERGDDRVWRTRYRHQKYRRRIVSIAASGF